MPSIHTVFRGEGREGVSSLEGGICYIFLAGNHARNGAAIFVKFKNLFTLQTSFQVFHSIRILWPWYSASSKWFQKNCYHNGSTKLKYTAAIMIFLCVPKARGWPWGWQMHELWAMQNLLMLHPQDWKGIQIPHSCPGSEWEHLKLTDA